MPDLVNVTYARTGRSIATNSLGMREMQARAFAAGKAQYLLLKAPPASGKSRALMFLGLDKLFNQGLKKVIVAVPERSIGSSFAETDLTRHGFFADWAFNPVCNLCTPGGVTGKVAAFANFLNDPAEAILICTHATLRFAFEAVAADKFNDTLLAIDEFHHVSADSDNRLGEVIRFIMANTSAHIIAMTGSYFRGDSVPVLQPADEAKFTKVTYNYYEQLNGYEHMKTLGIGYHFYQGRYLSAIGEVLDTDKKTILHIPNVNAGESTKDKHQEVNSILDIIGVVSHQDPDTGVIFVKRHGDGKIIKVADLVEDSQRERDKIVGYLREMNALDDMDLNMLKAITASLLMEQVLAPNFKFKTRRFDDEPPEVGTLKIRGFKEPSSQRVKDIVE
nr:DEAD/DEAH box helicase family protein [Desulfobulbaceae bacterium]